MGDVLKQRVEETVRNLGKFIDRTFTKKKPLYYVPAKFILPKKAEVFHGSFVVREITRRGKRWVNPGFPSHCRFDPRYPR